MNDKKLRSLLANFYLCCMAAGFLFGLAITVGAVAAIAELVHVSLLSLFGL